MDIRADNMRAEVKQGRASGPAGRGSLLDDADPAVAFAGADRSLKLSSKNPKMIQVWVEHAGDEGGQTSAGAHE